MRDSIMDVAVMIGVVLVVAWTVGMCAITFTADSRCLQHGYPGASVAWTGTAYCIRRVNQTDEVVPLRSFK